MIAKFYVWFGKSIEEVTNDLAKVYEEEKAMALHTIKNGSSTSRRANNQLRTINEKVDHQLL